MGEPIDEAITFYDDFLIDTLNIYYQPHQVSILERRPFYRGSSKGRKKKAKTNPRCPF